MSNGNEASAVYVGEDKFFGGWYASILLFTNHVETDCLAGRGETRQDAIDNLQKEIRRLYDQWQSASHAFKRFLLEEAT